MEGEEVEEKVEMLPAGRRGGGRPSRMARGSSINIAKLQETLLWNGEGSVGGARQMVCRDIVGVGGTGERGKHCCFRDNGLWSGIAVHLCK